MIFRDNGNFELLGGPIGSDEFCNDHTQKRVDKAKELLSALGELPDPQVALTLLRHCASFNRLVYSLRVVPHYKQRAALSNFDDAVRDTVESFLSCTFSNAEWPLATLSTKSGGLGLRSTELHSPGAFLASQAACHEICLKVDPNYSWNPREQNSDSYKALIAYNSRVNQDSQIPITNILALRQQTMSQAIDSYVQGKLRDNFNNDPRFQAHMNLTTASGAGSWLHVVPSKAIGTQVDS